MKTSRIHHINFVVRDLDEAIPRFQRTLGLADFETIEHPARAAKIARSRVGESWFVLVQPHDDDSVPGQFLAEHGEGFFLLSFSTPDDDQLDWRRGILDWQVSDLGEIHGALFQATLE